MLLSGSVCLSFGWGWPFLGWFMPRLLSWLLLILQSDIFVGEIDLSTGERLLLGDRFTILISRYGMIVEAAPSFFSSSSLSKA